MKPNPKSSHTWHRGMRKYRRWFGLLGFPKGTDIMAHGTPHPITSVPPTDFRSGLRCQDGHPISYAKDGRYYHVVIPALPFVTTTMSDTP